MAEVDGALEPVVDILIDVDRLSCRSDGQQMGCETWNRAPVHRPYGHGAGP
jgi:hypothetical protein